MFDFAHAAPRDWGLGHKFHSLDWFILGMSQTKKNHNNNLFRSFQEIA